MAARMASPSMIAAGRPCCSFQVGALDLPTFSSAGDNFAISRRVGTRLSFPQEQATSCPACDLEIEIFRPQEQGSKNRGDMKEGSRRNGTKVENRLF